MTTPIELTRPIIGIENRTAQEVFDIMCDRIRALPAIGTGWREMGNAPKNGANILYVTKFDDIGFCHWDNGYNEDDYPCWWDSEHDDEVCPVAWLPADVLPLQNGGAGE